MLMPARVVSLGLALGLLTTACATVPGPPSAPVAQFPSPSALAAVEARQVELPAVPAVEVPAEGWTSDPARAPVAVGEPWQPAGPVELAFASAFAAAKRPARLTRALGCVGDEIGRFVLEHGAAPPESLQRVVNAGCGVFAPAVGFQSLRAKVPAQMSDEQVLAHFGAELGAKLVARLPAEAVEIGFAVVRAKGQLIAIADYDAAPVDLQPFSVAPDPNGDVVVSGRLRGDAAYFAGLINQGAYGVRPCSVDAAVARPQFRITCRAAREDETAWMEIVYAPPGTVLALPLAQILVRRDPSKPVSFQAPASAQDNAKPVADAAQFRAAVLEALNATRAKASMGPVRLSTLESDTAAGVARQYFAAALGAGGIGDMNTVALGLLAGWQVQGTIRGGTFFAALLPATRDVGRWLDFALTLPIGRDALLQPDVEEIALGPAFLRAPDGIGAVVTGYRLQHGDDHAADVAAVLRRITEARTARGLSLPKTLPGFDAAITDELGAVKRGEENPGQALQASLQRALRRYERSVRGLVVEAITPDAFEIPAELIAQPNLQLAIGAVHYKPPGAAWAQLVIVVVYVSSASFVNI
jgi:hypothetical protein